MAADSVQPGIGERASNLGGEIRRIQTQIIAGKRHHVRADPTRDQATPKITKEDSMRVMLIGRGQSELDGAIKLCGQQADARHSCEFAGSVGNGLLHTDLDCPVFVSLRRIELGPMEIAPQELALKLPISRSGEREVRGGVHCSHF